MEDFAKFNATLAKVNFNGKKTVVTLELENRTAQQNIEFLMNNIDEMVIVSLGDPQMKLDLSAGEARQGVTARVDQSGVVESVESEEDESEQLEIDDEQEKEGPIDEEFDFTDEEEERAS